jgi:hypothetical protein
MKKLTWERVIESGVRHKTKVHVGWSHRGIMVKRSTYDLRVLGSNPMTAQVTLCPWARHLT